MIKHKKHGLKLKEPMEFVQDLITKKKYFACCCGYIAPESSMTTYNGKFMCEGCAESEDLFAHDDPHGKGWRNE